MAKYGVFGDVATTRRTLDVSKIGSVHNSQQMHDILLPFVRDIVKANTDYRSMQYEFHELHEYVMQFSLLQSECVESAISSCLKTICKEEKTQ